MKLISSLSVLFLVLTASKIREISADDEEGYCSRDEVDCSDENIEEEADMVFIKGGTFTMGTDLPIFVADGEAKAFLMKLAG
jgi:formylglycine-generating enzyme required for sulfatase activity